MDNTKKRAIALGFFDGVHLGHQALLRRTMAEAQAHELRPAVFTFDRSPKEFVTGTPVPLITTVAERRRVVEELFPGMEVIVAPFDREMMETPWEDFILMLTQRLQGGFLVAGHDFRFGAKNAGDPKRLAERAAQLGLGCAIVPAVLMDGAVVSSTRIRGLLEAGDAEGAARLLGRPFSMEGSAICPHEPGLAHVRTVPSTGQLAPAVGVYVTQIAAEDRLLPAVTHVRAAKDGSVVAESRLLEGGASLPQGECRVEFLRFLRPERVLSAPGELDAQIRRDAENAAAYFAALEK